MAKYTNVDLIFKDRSDAGYQLAEKLLLYKLASPIVVGLPRGGIAVAKPIAVKLNTQLDIMVSKKIGAPSNPELAIGAVTSCGDYVISSYASELTDEVYLPGEKKWDYLQERIVYLINDCKERERKYLSHKSLPLASPSFTGQNVILVDDGIATGMTAMAAIKSIKKQNPKLLILAVPVISSQAYDEIKKQVSEIETLKIPKDFIAVGVHYLDFEAVTDDEIKGMLV